MKRENEVSKEKIKVGKRERKTSAQTAFHKNHVTRFNKKIDGFLSET